MTEGGSIDDLPAPDASRRWFVLHTRPRCEKKVSDYCRRKEYPVFLPMVARSHHYGKRHRRYQIPLFRGYVFALLDQVGSSGVRSNDHVANVLPVTDQESLLSQLNQVRRALATDAAMELLPDFKTGMAVEIRSGPMKGVEGVIHHIKNKTCIVLNVDFIQQSVAVEVEAEWLVPV